ncbi:hypothetical protein LCGC14_2723430 [marine sediment metagenome]|uniref:Uncharacterized protein n=1 Tax=marine sediment metagenome TaxID=412755 RepID=A0A0F9C176_9ZZZZ
MAWLEVVRLVAGLVFVLYVPGYVWSRVFFPDATALERMATSIALSAAFVPAVLYFGNTIVGLPITAMTAAGATLVIAGGGTIFLWRQVSLGESSQE